jgi:hypothetical protein
MFKKQSEEFAPLKNLQSLAKSNPIALLEQLGIDFNDLVDLKAKGGKDSPDLKYRELEARIERAERERLEAIEQSKQREQEQLTAHQQAAVDQFKKNLHSFLEENSAEFEFITAAKATDDVFDYIEKYFKHTGKILEFKDAAMKIEARLEQEAEQLLQLKKIQSKLGKKPDVNLSEEPFRKSPQRVTLTNALAAESSPQPKKISREESLAAAAKLIKFV